MPRKLVTPEGGFKADDLLTDSALFSPVGDLLATCSSDKSFLLSARHGYVPNQVARCLAPDAQTAVIPKTRKNSFYGDPRSDELIPRVPQKNGYQLVRVILQSNKK